MKMEQYVTKRRRIKLRHRGITQKKAYSKWDPVFKLPVHNPQGIQNRSVRKRGRWILCKEIMVVYFKNYLKQIKAACGQSAEFWLLRLTYVDHKTKGEQIPRGDYILNVTLYLRVLCMELISGQLSSA